MSRDLTVVCELNVDIVVDCGDVTPRFGQADQLVPHIGLVLGSSGAITAVAAARLGLDVGVIGAVADDVFGRFVLAELQGNGVDVSQCLVLASGSTGATTALIRSGGDRSMLTCPGVMGQLRAEDVSAAALGASAAVHVSSIYLQSGLRPGLPGLLRAARETGAVTTVDPGYDPAEQWTDGMPAVLDQVDYFLPNEVEARCISGLADAEAAGTALAAYGPTIVLKRGAQGVRVVGGTGSFGVRAEPVQPVDSTGAGDNFNAGFLATLVGGAGVREAAAMGVACGSLSTQGYGGTGRTVTADEAREMALRILETELTCKPAGLRHDR
ncbi:MAG TPA: carbohydrate kinase family protein [Streptosporangiaceae bacterium]|nr:carbohydrate kinase family protein [Streptosporangiaceae bacterium]